MKDPLDEVTLFTIRPVQLPGHSPEDGPEEGAVFRVRNGYEVQERYIALSPEVMEQIENFAAYLYSTGLAVTLADGDIDQVEANVASRLFYLEDLDFELEVVDVDRFELICALSTTSEFPPDLQQQFVSADVVLTGHELKDIATQISHDFELDAYWVGL